jgi:hypothetical protein
MIGVEDTHCTYEYAEHFKSLPASHQRDQDARRIKDGQRVAKGFSYVTDNNAEGMRGRASILDRCQLQCDWELLRHGLLRPTKTPRKPTPTPQLAYCMQTC